ncbi:hypothetical protein ACS0TY_012570 [Phlomoides rotata]
MEKKSLYEAASTGNVAELLRLHKNDPFIVERISYTCTNNTPLHIATLNNHLPFVEKILELNPHLSEELNSQQSSPLHIAAAKGRLEIAKKLFDAAPDMCLSRDRQGRNPLHLAAIKGHVPVLELLARRSPVAAREKMDRGLTVLHLCVQHGRLDALKMLMEQVKVKVDDKNDDGKTILDMAIDGEQVGIIHYLKRNSSINMNGNNSNEETTTAIPQQKQTQPVKWLTKKRDAIMVVAILIATMAFQVGVSPPGGIWQDDSTDIAKPYRAGESVMAHNNPKAFKSFMRSNTICFVSSLSTILLLISGLPFRRRILMWILMVIMWLTITTVAVTFAISIVVVTPKKDKKSLKNVISIAVGVWIGVMGILLIGNTVRLVDRWLKIRGVNVWRPRWCRDFVQGKENARLGKPV